MATTREQPGRYQRSPSGLVGALLVMFVVIVGFVVFRSLFRGNQDEPVQAVDYAPLLRQARTDGLLSAPAPQPMPPGWRATSVRYANTSARPTWHLGLLTQHQTYVALEEARAPAQDLVRTYLGKQSTRGGNVKVGGSTWTSWHDGSSYALTRVTGGATVLVGGPAGKESVLTLTRALTFGQPHTGG